MDEDLKKRIEVIANAVAGMKYYEWRNVRIAIERKFASAHNVCKLSDAEAIIKTIALEF